MSLLILTTDCIADVGSVEFGCVEKSRASSNEFGVIVGSGSCFVCDIVMFDIGGADGGRINFAHLSSRVI